MKECATHHYACDCREAKFKKLVEALEKIIAKSHSWVVTMDTGPIEKPIHDMYREIAKQALQEIKK
jgi:predicted transcriptional regulator YdeE